MSDNEITYTCRGKRRLAKDLIKSLASEITSLSASIEAATDRIHIFKDETDRAIAKSELSKKQRQLKSKKNELTKFRAMPGNATLFLNDCGYDLTKIIHKVEADGEVHSIECPKCGNIFTMHKTPPPEEAVAEQLSA